MGLPLALALAIGIGIGCAVARATPATAGGGFEFLTEAERTDFARTGRLSEVAAFGERLGAAGQGCEVLGLSPEGRPLHAYVLSSVPVAERARSAAYRRRPAVLVLGGIHAGEIDGKDASFLLVKRLLDPSQLHPVLDEVTVAIVPVLNVDGHERFGANHRPNQRGPEEMGWRATAANLNLNRDWVKADAPETRMLLELIQRLDPVVIVDLHVTDGAKFRHDIAVLVEPWHDDGTDTALIGAAQALGGRLQAHLAETGHRPLDFYPEFEVVDDPASGFARGVAPVRFTHGYVARRGRIGVLVETHSWVPYKARVEATLDTLVGLLREARTAAPGWRAAADATDRLRRDLPGKRVDLAFAPDTNHAATLDFLGYAYARVPSEVSGARWTVYDESRPEVWKVPILRQVKSTAFVTAPPAYAVLPGFASVVAERLRAHGIAFRTLATERSVRAEPFIVTNVVFGARPYEGRQTATVQGSWVPTPPRPTPGATVSAGGAATILPVGTLVIPVGQPCGRLVVELMEPWARDSLCAWGFFNARFERKEYMEAYVAEAVAREQLKDPAVKAGFEARLESDPAFRTNPVARLEFFYQRHPSFDPVHNVLPVYRLAEAL